MPKSEVQGMSNPSPIGPDGFTRLAEIVAGDSALVRLAREEAESHVEQLRDARDRAERRVEAVAAVLASGPDTWTPYESRDTGWTFLQDSVLDFTADLRAALLGGDPS